MMFDRDLVAVSPSSSYPRPQERWPARLLEAEALAQGQRFCAAARTPRALARRCLLYLCSLLDGCSRSIVHWELREGRPGVPLSLQDARRLVSGFVQHYNTVRLHSAIGYITPPEGQRKRNGVHKSSQAPSLERFGVSRPEIGRLERRFSPWRTTSGPPRVSSTTHTARIPCSAA